MGGDVLTPTSLKRKKVEMTYLQINKIDSSENLITFEEITTGVKAQVMRENMYKAMENLYYWRRDLSATNFSSMLYTLLCKADDRNKMKIFVGFPEETICFLLWYTKQGISEPTFFCKWLKELKYGNKN